MNSCACVASQAGEWREAGVSKSRKFDSQSSGKQEKKILNIA